MGGNHCDQEPGRWEFLGCSHILDERLRGALRSLLTGFVGTQAISERKEGVQILCSTDALGPSHR